MQSNSYSSGGSADNGGSRVEYQNSSAANQQTSANSAENRPGSRLKANIDELDTLLSDLNNAQTQRSTNSQQHETSSEDYGEQSSQLQVNNKPPAQKKRGLRVVYSFQGLHFLLSGCLNWSICF